MLYYKEVLFTICH